MYIKYKYWNQDTKTKSFQFSWYRLLNFIAVLSYVAIFLFTLTGNVWMMSFFVFLREFSHKVMVIISRKNHEAFFVRFISKAKTKKKLQFICYIDMKYKLKIMMNWNLWGYDIVLFLLNHWFGLLHFWLQLDYMCAYWHFNLLLSLHKDEASIVEKWNQSENYIVGK